LARKFQSAATAGMTLSQVKFRLARALNEGRFAQALDLAKQVYKAEPVATNQETLFNAHLGRARELRTQNKPRDAAATLQDAVGLLDANPGLLLPLAEELAACGEARQALTLVQHAPDSPARQRVLARAADSAVQLEVNGQSLLLQEMRGDFDRVMQAFTRLHAGEDEAAREALRQISLRSPFLEWKLLLRGLQAYYQKDDARAIENWQRLTPERLPARVVAPLRARIDPAYRLAQPPAAQTALRQQADRLQDPGLAPQLRTLQTALAGEGTLPPAFRAAQTLLPTIRQQAPNLVPRLAACFYWAIVNSGHPDDVPRYLATFGPPRDDPECHRLRALASERHHELAAAHVHWQEFEKSVAANPAAWPAEEGKRARALIWLHAGRNAASAIETDRLPDLPAFLRNLPNQPRRLKPSADKCFRNSIKLAPDLLAAHEGLFQYRRERGESAKADKAARQLLRCFPEHGPTLEGLADLLGESGRHAEALELFRRALQHHPLDRTLRAKISAAHVHQARISAAANQFQEARAEYRAALEFEEGEAASFVTCGWAACELKAGDATRAEELHGQARELSGSRLPVAYAMLIEVIRLKLPRPVKARFDRDFAAALAEPPTASSAVVAIQTAAAHHAEGICYAGQKTHEKKVLAYLDAAALADFTEPELAAVCKALLALKAIRPLRVYCKRAAWRFPRAAIFPYFEAESYFAHGPERVKNTWQAKPLLDTAHRLASDMPPDERRTRLLENISDRQKLVRMLELGPFGLLQNAMEQLGDFDDFDDDWDCDDGW
jgi:tetratricopeptide (TPR) repeat protein